MRCIGCLRAEKSPEWFAVRLRDERLVFAVPAVEQALWRDAAPLCKRCRFDLKFELWALHVLRMFGSYPELRMPRDASIGEVAEFAAAIAAVATRGGDA